MTGIQVSERSEHGRVDAREHSVVVSNLTKRFPVLHRGTFKQAVLGVFRKRRMEAFTALKDISFEVPHGQTIAVIGRNGSGKSTLLGILARIYKPTSGRVAMYSATGGPARTAPLLELGAGFNPELDGLENIVFYAAVLGMSARQTSAKLDAIVDFAELAQKIDTPLRGWNDGAKLRLGFAIAVHTDPDILLVDEVLAVGDEAFQEKCRRRIVEMQSMRTTIVFVSHDPTTVLRIAQRVIWLDQGSVRMDGDAESVVAAYVDASRQPHYTDG